MKKRLSLWGTIALSMVLCSMLTATANAGLYASEDWEAYSLGRASPNLDGWEYVTDVASPPWNTLDGRDSVWIGNARAGDNTYPTGNSGEQFVGMNASYLWQNTGRTFAEGITYTVSLQATAATAGEGLYLYIADHDPMEGADLGTSVALDFFDVPDTDFLWNAYSMSYTATAADVGKDVVFALYGRGATYVDDITVASSAPEPSTFVLAAIGLVGLVLASRRRTRLQAAE